MRKIILFILVLVITAANFDLGAAESLPPSAHVKGFVGYPQSYNLSCESRSAVDLAAYWGINIGESEFLVNLPRSDNPDAGFVGNPNHAWGNIPPNSYGVHARPVAALLREYGLQAKARHNMSWRSLRSEIAAGRPVIVWVIGSMLSGYPVEYTASDGHKTTVAYFEHTMVVTGYGPEEVQVLDAYTGVEQTYRRATFMASWGVLGRMAVTGFLEKEEAAVIPEVEVVLRLPVVYQHSNNQKAQAAATPKPKPALPETYVVQPGDYLTALAREFDLDWYDLAVLNGIGYPYVIYPGQVLRLR
jgi:uncharacterized protein YvpB